MTRVFCVGNGVSSFVPPIKPKKGAETKGSFDLFEEAASAARSALDEAGIEFDAVEAAVCGYAFSDSTAGQAAVYRLGLTGLPVYNVNNACASGSTALSLARTLVQAGHDCVLALGFEQLRGNVKEAYPEHGVYGGHLDVLGKLGIVTLPGVISASIANAYIKSAQDMVEAGTGSKQAFAQVAAKNLRHGENNPNALSFGKPSPSVDEILTAPPLFDESSPITFAMVAKSACGASAALIVSERFMREKMPQATAVEIVGQSLRTDTPATFDATGDPKRALADLCGFGGARHAADIAFAEAGLCADDVDVVELHDAFSSSELAMCEALRLCKAGAGVRFVTGGAWKPTGSGGELFHYERGDGKKPVVVNPSGGLISKVRSVMHSNTKYLHCVLPCCCELATSAFLYSHYALIRLPPFLSQKGHPTGATGLAQCAELCWQLRGKAGKRQVKGAQVGLQHNYGWSSAAVVTVYRVADMGSAGKSRL
jgi:sterol carrier protein 2